MPGVECCLFHRANRLLPAPERFQTSRAGRALGAPGGAPGPSWRPCVQSPHRLSAGSR